MSVPADPTQSEAASRFRAWYLVVSWTVNAGALVGVFWLRGHALPGEDQLSGLFGLAGWFLFELALLVVACGFILAGAFRRVRDLEILIDWIVPPVVTCVVMLILGRVVR